jgi:hypothetical protein
MRWLPNGRAMAMCNWHKQVAVPGFQGLAVARFQVEG